MKYPRLNTFEIGKAETVTKDVAGRFLIYRIDGAFKSVMIYPVYNSNEIMVIAGESTIYCSVTKEANSNNVTFTNNSSGRIIVMVFG